MMENMFNKEDEAVRPHSRRLGRELAMQFLFCCDARTQMPNAADFDVFFEAVRDEFHLKDNHLAHRAQDMAMKLYQCVALHREELDQLIGSHCENWSWERLSPVDRNIMRIAVAEMFYSDVPPVVCIDEAVEIARDYSGADAGNFINGVLNTVKNVDLPKRDREEKGK